jgi:hypothetical protein
MYKMDVMIVRGMILMIMQSCFSPDGYSTSQISINMENATHNIS